MIDEIKLPKINPKKLPLLLLCLLAIFSCLWYFAAFTEQITTITYHNGVQTCNETYINGKLNSTECPDFYKKSKVLSYNLNYSLLIQNGTNPN